MGIMHMATVQISMEHWGGILCLIFSAMVFLGEDRGTKRGHLLIFMLWGISLMLFCDSAAWYFAGHTSRLGYYGVRISNFVVFVINYYIGYIALLYLEEILRLNNRTLPTFAKVSVRLLCLTGTVLVTVSQFTGLLYGFSENNMYSRAGGYWMIAVVAALLVFVMINSIVIYARELPKIQFLPLLSIYVLTLLADLVQFFIYGLSLVNHAMTIGMVIMFFCYQRELMEFRLARDKQLLEQKLRIAEQEIEIRNRDLELANKEVELANKEVELTEKRTQIMLSQIQPHFMYNTLSAISFLCIKDPMKAKDTVDYFSSFLRTNLNALKSDYLVTFDKELEHTKAYLFIEKVRFADDLNIEYDIQCTDFTLPSLSLQPLVENAVKHGICGKEDGGTVKISSFRKEGKVYITVEDDGVGFDPKAAFNDGRVHIGMENVHDRLASLVGGELVIDSTPGVGTKATIILKE